eukprot:jgi/Botrbrau1/7108/Bobra.0165s0126.1
MSHEVQRPVYVSVQHELLLALLGHTGDLFVDMSEKIRMGEGVSKDPKISSLKVVPGADWLDPCHRESLNRILKLGYHYTAIEQFVMAQNGGSDSRGCSAIRTALATGLTEVLDVYRSAVLRVQQLLRKDVSFTLSSLSFYLDEWPPRFASASLTNLFVLVFSLFVLICRGRTEPWTSGGHEIPGQAGRGCGASVLGLESDLVPKDWVTIKQN